MEFWRLGKVDLMNGRKFGNWKKVEEIGQTRWRLVRWLGLLVSSEYDEDWLMNGSSNEESWPFWPTSFLRLVHSACMTAAAHPYYFVVDSESGGDKVVDVWVPWKGWWKSQKEQTSLGWHLGLNSILPFSYTTVFLFSAHLNKPRTSTISHSQAHRRRTLNLVMIAKSPK